MKNKKIFKEKKYLKQKKMEQQNVLVLNNKIDNRVKREIMAKFLELNQNDTQIMNKAYEYLKVEVEKIDQRKDQTKLLSLLFVSVSDIDFIKYMISKVKTAYTKNNKFANEISKQHDKEWNKNSIFSKLEKRNLPDATRNQHEIYNLYDIFGNENDDNDVNYDQKDDVKDPEYEKHKKDPFFALRPFVEFAGFSNDFNAYGKLFTAINKNTAQLFSEKYELRYLAKNEDDPKPYGPFVGRMSNNNVFKECVDIDRILVAKGEDEIYIRNIPGSTIVINGTTYARDFGKKFTYDDGEFLIVYDTFRACFIVGKDNEGNNEDSENEEQVFFPLGCKRSFELQKDEYGDLFIDFEYEDKNETMNLKDAMGNEFLIETESNGKRFVFHKKHTDEIFYGTIDDEDEEGIFNDGERNRKYIVVDANRDDNLMLYEEVEEEIKDTVEKNLLMNKDDVRALNLFTNKFETVQIFMAQKAAKFNGKHVTLRFNNEFDRYEINY